MIGITFSIENYRTWITINSGYSSVQSEKHASKQAKKPQQIKNNCH